MRRRTDTPTASAPRATRAATVAGPVVSGELPAEFWRLVDDPPPPMRPRDWHDPARRERRGAHTRALLDLAGAAGVDMAAMITALRAHHNPTEMDCPCPTHRTHDGAR